MTFRPLHGWLLAFAVSPYPLIALQGSPMQKQKIDYARDIAPIMKASCTGCHGAVKPAAGLDLTTMEGVRKAVRPTNADGSLLLQRVLGKGGKQQMPIGMPPLPNSQVALIRDWIDQGAGNAPLVSYSKDVLPLFKAHCVTCHGSTNPAAGLDLSKGDSIKKVVVAGKPEASALVQRLKGLGGKQQMPIGFAPLSAAQIGSVEQWIAAGASTADGSNLLHWAYRAPVLPAIPGVKNKAWVANPIDAFVLAKLEKEGLKPSSQASKETLIRRVSLDLTGLPPSPGEVDAFLADDSSNAYEKVVDRLLASRHYGERQTQPWLDLSRYADSDGYEKDLNRTVWKYRDWLIDAFNRNERYDQFTIDQIAGDMLPKPSVDQLVATGFNRNTMFNREGGVDQKEAHFNVVIDRVSTTATVWLGSTIQCARCHDHKYDPFSQKDFYRMIAFFDNAVIIPRGDAHIGEQNYFEPEIQVPTVAQTARKAELEGRAKELEATLETSDGSLNAERAKWQEDARHTAQWVPLANQAIKSSVGSTFNLLPDASFLATSKPPERDNYTVSGKTSLDSVSGIRIEALTDPSLGGTGPGRTDNGNFVLTGLVLKVNGVAVPLDVAAADFTQEQYDAFSVAKRNRGNGWAVYPNTGKPHELILEAENPMKVEPGAKIEVVLEHQSTWEGHQLGRFRISLTSSPASAATFAPADVKKALAANPRSAADEAKLKDYYRTFAAGLRGVRKELGEVNMALQAVNNAVATALVMQDMPITGPLTSNIRPRGEFLSKGDQVTASVPAIFPALKTEPATRLGFAQWLVRKDNPLTARVQVNRMWEQYFGHGIVETSEDFGTQGTQPTHPELLDWLACQFMNKGWDMKAMHKLIVMSSTYRQSSEASAALEEKDPKNQLYARGPRFRLDAETIRDAALKEAGLLNGAIGGPSVFPAQPTGVWDTPYNGEQWMTSDNGDQYRRGMYTFWKRSSPYPSFISLDATSRESCLVRRIRTNTPLQALAMMNDPVMMDAARGLARRSALEGGKDPGSRITFAFRVVTGREPNKKELDRLQALRQKLVDRYTKDSANAMKLGGSPEKAAWTMLCNVLLNLDETVTKE